MIQFGEFTLDKKQSKLLYQEQELTIDPKLFELLLIFVKQPNITITRQYILDHLWSGSIVTDNAINKLIANLRKVLADDPKNPRYIQTIPKRGYRLICEVTLLETTNATPAISHTQSNIKRLQPRAFNYTKVALFLMICSVFIWQVISYTEQPVNKGYSIELTRAKGAEESAQMHPDKKHLFYLKNNSEETANQLWVKNIHTSKVSPVDIGQININNLFAVVAEINDETTNLFYLDKLGNRCGVYKATLIHRNQGEQASVAMVWQQSEKLFDCSDKRIKDIDYHEQRKEIYYAAQPKNLWPNQIYVFNLATKKHRFVTQDEPEGWGHHGIDVSPDGNKLLIMSTNSDYKTQLLVLNLTSNEITKGFRFDYPVYEAIWVHDSEQVLYYAASPLHQIIKSDLNGENATTIVSVSEYLSPQMSLFPDGKNILFSTQQKNYSNRWLVAPEPIDNSTVGDTNPALFHHNSNYLFISKRSGRRQLYLGRHDSNHAEIVSNLKKSLWLKHLAVSADDQSILLNVENKIYHISISDLSGSRPLNELNSEQLIFTSEDPIISLDWLTKNGAAITIVNNGIPELKVINLLDKCEQKLEGNWAYGIGDSQHLEYSYLVEQQSNVLYRIDSDIVFADKKITPSDLTNTQQALPNDFFHVKIDSNILYFGTNDGYLNVIPLNNVDENSKYLLNELNSYDVRKGQLMLSDIESIEGDVHRTMH